METERINRTDDFISSILLASLRSRKHFLPGIKLAEDGGRYVNIARTMLVQKPEFHPVRGADIKPKTTKRSDWRLLYFRNHHVLEQHALQLMMILLTEDETDQIKDFALFIDEAGRAKRIDEIRNERTSKIIIVHVCYIQYVSKAHLLSIFRYIDTSPIIFFYFRIFFQNT